MQPRQLQARTKTTPNPVSSAFLRRGTDPVRAGQWVRDWGSSAAGIFAAIYLVWRGGFGRWLVLLGVTAWMAIMGILWGLARRDVKRMKGLPDTFILRVPALALRDVPTAANALLELNLLSSSVAAEALSRLEQDDRAERATDLDLLALDKSVVAELSRDDFKRSVPYKEIMESLARISRGALPIKDVQEQASRADVKLTFTVGERESEIMFVDPREGLDLTGLLQLNRFVEIGQPLLFCSDSDSLRFLYLSRFQCKRLAARGWVFGDKTRNALKEDLNLD